MQFGGRWQNASPITAYERGLSMPYAPHPDGFGDGKCRLP
jgi:hypothetical protein